MGQKYARIFTLGHYLLLEAHSFPRATLSGQIMSSEKYPSIFLRQMEAIVYRNCFLVLGVRRAAFDCDVFIVLFIFRCIALTAALTNGASVGMRGCFPATAGNCTDTSACNQRNGTLPRSVYFARCVAECCTGEKCNANLFPMLPESSSTVEVVVSSTPVSNPTQPDVYGPTPTSLGIKMRAFLYLPLSLLATLVIMN